MSNIDPIEERIAAIREKADREIEQLRKERRAETFGTPIPMKSLPDIQRCGRCKRWPARAGQREVDGKREWYYYDPGASISDVPLCDDCRERSRLSLEAERGC